MCGCLEDGDMSALANLSIEERANVGADKMKR